MLDVTDFHFLQQLLIVALELTVSPPKLQKFAAISRLLGVEGAVGLGRAFAVSVIDFLFGLGARFVCLEVVFEMEVSLGRLTKYWFILHFKINY